MLPAICSCQRPFLDTRQQLQAFLLKLYLPKKLRPLVFMELLLAKPLSSYEYYQGPHEMETELG